MKPTRPCERQCGRCKLWLHHSRFRTRDRTRRTKRPHGTVWEFNPLCRACEQIERNQSKNIDRPLAIIQRRAQEAAHKAGESRAFFWEQMNYRALVPILRAMMSAEGICLACGHPFASESDVQIEHCEPPRHAHDWARLHARNLRLLCRSCNVTKTNKPLSAWLDDQETARLSNLDQPMLPPPEIDQLTLF